MSSIRTRLAHMIANQLIIPYRQFLTSLRSLCFVGDHILTSPPPFLSFSLRGYEGDQVSLPMREHREWQLLISLLLVAIF